MIIACPSCSTRFLADAEALSARASRRIGCANCGHVWDHGAPEAATTGTRLARAVVPSGTPEPSPPRHIVAAAPGEPGSRLDPPHPLPAEMPAAARPHAKSGVRHFWVIAVALAVAGVAFAARERIVALPSPARPAADAALAPAEPVAAQPRAAPRPALATPAPASTRPETASVPAPIAVPPEPSAAPRKTARHRPLRRRFPRYPGYAPARSGWSGGAFGPSPYSDGGG